LSKFPILLTTALISLLGAGLVFSGASQADPRRRDSQEEALLGSYRCGAGPSEAFLSLAFSATGDVFNDETNLFRSVSVPSTPGETCEFYSLALLDSIAVGSCKVSPVEISADETGESRSFQFVCSAGRPTIIRIIADVSAAFLTSSP
jgi:hypothetical protein